VELGDARAPQRCTERIDVGEWCRRRGPAATGTAARPVGAGGTGLLDDRAPFAAVGAPTQPLGLLDPTRLALVTNTRSYHGRNRTRGLGHFGAIGAGVCIEHMVQSRRVHPWN